MDSAEVWLLHSVNGESESMNVFVRSDDGNARVGGRPKLHIVSNMKLTSDLWKLFDLQTFTFNDLARYLTHIFPSMECQRNFSQSIFSEFNKNLNQFQIIFKFYVFYFLFESHHLAQLPS